MSQTLARMAAEADAQPPVASVQKSMLIGHQVRGYARKMKAACPGAGSFSGLVPLRRNPLTPPPAQFTRTSRRHD